MLKLCNKKFIDIQKQKMIVTDESKQLSLENFIMDENRVINSLRVLRDKRIYNLLFQPVTRYIKYSTVKFPKKLDIQPVVLSNDN